MPRRRGEEGVHGLHRAPRSLCAGDDPAPRVRDVGVDGEDPALEARRQVMLEPSLEPVAARARIESVDARADLAERQDTEEEPILVRLVKPLDEPGVGSRL